MLGHIKSQIFLEGARVASSRIRTNDVHTAELLRYLNYKCCKESTSYSRDRAKLPNPSPETRVPQMRLLW